MNRYVAIILTLLSCVDPQAQTLKEAPKLVINIVIDQLRTDYIEYFSPLFCQEGFRKLLEQGKVYDAASYPYVPIDKSSAIATIATGTSPYYHGIVGTRWMDRTTLRPIFCVNDASHNASPSNLLTSTIGDEMKVSSHGSAIVWSIAPDPESAVLSAGHAANGAIWIDQKTMEWMSSSYYRPTASEWLKSYLRIYPLQSKNQTDINESITDLALLAISSTAMGRDRVCDLLSLTYSAAPILNKNTSNWQVEMESIYMQLDKAIARLITNIETLFGNNQVLFVLTSTGYTKETSEDLASYNIPTGTFYINRTANLLNMYLSAIFGQGRYIETCFANELYLNHKLLEQKHIGISDVLQRCQEFLILNAGVADVYTSERLLNGNNDIQKLRNGFNATINGDIIIAVKPGWNLVNEETQDKISLRSSFVPFPIILYGANIQPERISTPVSTDRIAPTIAKSIHIRAPNACSAEPLF